ncbi:MAG TPA: CPBP family intramembrane glutamic endopeptidase [Chthoniobacterales bacterium]|nr:CPBP family intramembrane glutamic endopeptidase [Chthoniobacterales bacterium]
MTSTGLIDEHYAARLRGFGLLGILAILFLLSGNLLFTPLSAVLVLVWAWISRTPWREIGYVRPRSWITTIAIGILFGVGLKLVMKSVVMPLLGAPPVNGPFHFLAHNPAEIPSMLYIIVIGAGFGEETVFRGWAFERFGKLLGSAPWAKAITVLFTAAWFGQQHYGLQGMVGVENAAIVGLVFGAVFAVTGRLFLLMIAHTAFDLAAYAMIYWDFETAVAHFFFK